MLPAIIINNAPLHEQENVHYGDLTHSHGVRIDTRYP